MRVVGKIGSAGVIACAVLALAACGSDDKSDTAASTTTTAAKSSSVAAQAQSKGRECTADDIKVQGGFGEAPTITLPDDCDPPKTLITKDLVVGTGPAAKSGDKISTNYTLITWSDKKKLDSSFDRGKELPLALGAGQVIQGWDQGLEGATQGTRRLLIVPPDLGYGATSKGGMKPNETLVFVTDVVKVG